ncbi:MAG TPA: 50S ribosomal protein L4 [Nitrospiraceae bacterium]|nr:50S ribosomal protein L4 [Nitrospiraceae bacterium]
MPTVEILDLHKRKVGSVELPDSVFGAVPDRSLLHEAVVMQQACARQGTSSTLRRGEVSGSGKKPWKQKHTGRARAGSIRSPVWRHGGTVFGPRPRSYAFALPKKKYRAALRQALSAKLAAGGILIVSDLRIEEPKTRLLAKTLAQLGLSAKTLVVVGAGDTDLEQAARNLPQVKLVKSQELNVYDVLRYHTIVIPERELPRLREFWS